MIYYITITILCYILLYYIIQVFAPIRKTYKYVAMPDACMDKDGQLPKWGPVGGGGYIIIIIIMIIVIINIIIIIIIID